LEQEILDFIKSNLPGEQILSRDRKIISPFELDIFIPRLNLAFEVDGSYWHSSKFVSVDKVTNKFKLCLDKNIKLITIQESKYRNSEALVKNRILSALNGEKNKIYARKCHIVPLESQTKNFFFSQNHLDGDARASKAFALVYKNEVVMAMSFAKSRFNRKIDWEIIRSCSRVGMTVVGGTSKLIKHFSSIHPAASLITYADLDWGIGDSYAKAGMTFSHFSKPGYHYIGQGHVRFSRYVAQKKKLLKLLGPEKYNPLLTEMANMINAGYLVVYDRGNAVYTLNGSSLDLEIM
jgi:hypothetical protein